MITPRTQTYFRWSEISEELLKRGFSEADLESYRKKFLVKVVNRDENPNPGSVCGYNLYYFGPSPAEIVVRLPDPLRGARLGQGRLRKMTHAIWDLLADHLTGDMLEDTLIEL
jgi:hypothetical protein